MSGDALPSRGGQDDVRAFVASLDSSIAEVLGGLLATYVHGSASLGGFVPGRSDIDVLFVVDREPTSEQLAAAARTAHEMSRNSPGRCIEFSVVTADAVRDPGAPWPFLLHVGTGEPNAKTVLGESHPGDPDLLMHYVVCRTAAIVVRGPHPRDLIGTIDRASVLGYLAGELGWGIEHAPEHYGVLNACRALAYLEDGHVLSKIDGAQFVLARQGPSDLITDALAMQLGSLAERPPSAEARAFIHGIAQRLEAGTS